MQLTVNGTHLYFDVEGVHLVPDGPAMRQRPTLLLLHGGAGFDHTYFKPFLSPLADTAQLVYLDQRGQGRSGRPPLATFSIEQMADDAAAFCRALGIERPIVLGHSLGGFVALHLALRHPDVPGGLILSDTAAASDDTAPDEAIAGLERRYGAATRAAVERTFDGTVADENIADTLRALLTTFFHPHTGSDVQSAVWSRTTLSLPLAAYYRRHVAGSHDVRERLGQIRVPTLVVVGEDDWVTPVSASEALAAGIPGAELCVVRDAAHMVFNDQPDRFNTAVREFLNTQARKDKHMAAVMTAVTAAQTSQAEGMYDYTVPGRYPRSGRDQLGGIVFLPRAIDKMRAYVNGTVGEYNALTGMSGMLFELFDVTAEQFEQAVRANPTDEDVVRWLRERGIQAPTPGAIEQFNRVMLDLGPFGIGLAVEEAQAQLTAYLAGIGAANRTDVRTFLDLYDLEEGRTVPDRSDRTDQVAA